jgi:hypothetical protein
MREGNDADEVDDEAAEDEGPKPSSGTALGLEKFPLGFD